MPRDSKVPSQLQCGYQGSSNELYCELPNRNRSYNATMLDFLHTL